MRATLAGDSDGDSDVPPLVMDSGVEVLLLRMSLDPDGFAAAGITGTGLQSALAVEQDGLEGAVSTLEDLDAAFAEAKVSVDALRRKVKKGQATQEEVDQLQTAKTSLVSATAARTAFLDGLCDSLLEDVSNATAAAARQIRANQPWKNIPVAYRVEARTEAEWVEIRNALAAKRTHEAMGLDVPQSVVTFLSNLDSDTDVASAKANCSAKLAGVQATWDSVFGD